MLKKLRIEEYGPLFRGHIKRDFAVNERRPLFLLRKLQRQGMYDFLALRDDATGKLLAYAGLLHTPDTDALLLDYLAVEPQRRGGGTGSRFMQELAAHCEAGGILIECEAPTLARNAEEKKTRERRIAFYLKNGAVETGVRWHFLGVGYDLLWLPVKKQLAEVDVARDIVKLYGAGVPKLLMRLASKVLEEGAAKA